MLDHVQSGGPPDGTDGRARMALREALRRARLEAAERADVVIDLREAEIARLEILKDRLEPIFAQVPAEVDIFDVGIAPGERPRLFVDMVSFVEMGRDRRLYRFMRDGRHGRVCAVESESAEPIVEAVTAYVARRLVERERLLADDDRLAPAEGAGGPLQDAARAAFPPGAVQAAPPATMDEPPAQPVPPSAVRGFGSVEYTTAPEPRRRNLVGALFKLTVSFVLGAALGALVLGAVFYGVAKGYLPI